MRLDASWYDIKNNTEKWWASMVTIMLFIGGIQLLSLGVIGRYLSSIFLEVKDRPIYILSKKWIRNRERVCF